VIGEVNGRSARWKFFGLAGTHLAPVYSRPAARAAASRGGSRAERDAPDDPTKTTPTRQSTATDTRPARRNPCGADGTQRMFASPTVAGGTGLEPVTPGYGLWSNRRSRSWAQVQPDRP
jgi:hypothetical protein